jgi:hypothetical protein
MNATAGLRTFWRRVNAPAPLRRVWRVGLLVAVGLVSVELAPSATAQSGGTVTVDIPISATSAPTPVRSVTVGPNTATYGCSGQDGGLTFPNGACSTGQITITNGGVPSRILVNGDDAVPEVSGTNWVLCGASGGPACGGSGGLPGADQYRERTRGSSFFGPLDGPFLANSAQCDTAFAFGFDPTFGQPPAPTCNAAANQSSPETVRLVGPASSTTTADSFSTTITWTASP